MRKFSFYIIILVLFLFGFKKKISSIFEDKEYIHLLRTNYSSGDYSLWEAPFIDSSVVKGFQDIGKLGKVPFPDDNPYSKEKALLGKALFFDPRLSESGQIACASCHDSELGWADARRVSYGHNRQTGKRNSLSIINIGYHTTFFWDGRVTSLEQQAPIPLTDPVEMHSTEKQSVKNISKIKGYKELFERAFGSTQVTIERISQALATYQRTIISDKNTKFDRFISGESNKFTDEEVIGLHLFRTKARCINCHNTPLFSDQKFHNVGLSLYGRPLEDLGLYNITKQPEDVGRFKTPSLREVGRTAPYMHNGLMPDLEGIINMYNVGMPRPKRGDKYKDDPLFPTTSPLLQPLNLTKDEKNALKAFLLTLSSPAFRERPPELPK